MNNTKETITNIEEIFNVKFANAVHHTDKAQLGIKSMINRIFGGYEKFDGFKLTTTQHEYLILISNGQNCCESWGYMISEDDFSKYIGKNLVGVELTDTALNKKKVDDLYVDDDQIQFVDFRMSDGSILQFAVYNSHNGYYGHPIIIAKDVEILLQTTL